MKYSIKPGMRSVNGQVEILDEDRLCLEIKSISKGAIGVRTISKKLLAEFVGYFETHPESSAMAAREYLCGLTNVDKFEYGYYSTLTTLAKMVLGEELSEADKLLSSCDRKYYNDCLQLIFYGAPGTGKSYTVDNDTEPRRSVRTTFHPDSDYASFVGTYKPTIGDEPMSYISEGLAKYAKAWGNHPAKERKITYKFVPQAFMKAYVSAWKDLENPHYLIIEEINRGNCAQIFGDLFQLLDRNADGYSSYPVTADEDIRQYICDTFSKESESLKGLISSVSIVNCKGSEIVNGLEILSGEKLLLPPNLHIWATMNTSDQSLFPIDSAFKRRWDWKYVPINYDAETWMLNVDGKRYRWGDFLRAINPIITSVTESHDKQMGYFFVRSRDGEVSAETFLNKVLFYLWADVFKDFGLEHPVFRNETAQRPYEFSDFFRIDGTPDEAVIDSFLGNISEFYADNKDINLTPVSSVE